MAFRCPRYDLCRAKAAEGRGGLWIKAFAIADDHEDAAAVGAFMICSRLTATRLLIATAGGGQLSSAKKGRQQKNCGHRRGLFFAFSKLG
jgi:hypothetical protein